MIGIQWGISMAGQLGITVISRLDPIASPAAAEPVHTNLAPLTP